MSRSVPVTNPAAAPDDRFGERYELHELLGRGGMAQVHRATDRVLGRQVALKQLTVDISASDRSHLGVLFEREFHTLAQLSHPHVIGVFDYGIGPAGAPFYTMELLDGGDLRERPPLPWREACRLVFDVCSALALVHSRRLLHRDITPRNIRCTQAGIAKLIDFGAMSPMTAGGSDVVGTPAFTAPETLQRLALDARTDLYSLGVTLYYALTARLPYNARTFADLLSAWAAKPIVPSALVPEIPAALDDLVLALISVEPALRPASASEVMQRLAACAGLRLEESDSVSRAYLSTPTLVGRGEVLAELRDALRDSRLRRAASVLIRATPGAGRSRLLDACALEAATLGVTVSRATATGAREAFAVAQRLVNHMLDTLPRAAELAAVPELFAPAAAANDDGARPSLRDLQELEAARAQKLLRRFILGVSRTYPLLLAIDDVHKIDEPSAALLAELIDGTRRGGILVALTADSEVPETEALRALARRCRVLPLAPLSRTQTRELLDSLFGDVANLDLLSDEIHRVASGNPRQTLELAQHLVDRGLISYTSGSWTLPSRFSADDLPRSATAALQARIARFSALARVLAEAQALAFEEEFSDDDYRALSPSASSRDLDLAVSELLEAGAVLRDGAVYRLANRAWSAALLAQLDAEQAQLRHRALADMYAAKQSFGQLHHAFAGGLDERGLSLLDRRNVARTESDMQKIVERDGGKLVWCYPRAIETAKRLGHAPRRVHDLRRWQFLGSVVVRTPPDRTSAQIWLDQLIHDSGLDLYRADTESATPQARLMSALQRAHARYLATPEAERVYPVDEAIRKLGEYVVIGVVQASRALDSEMMHALPDFVEPFTALSPMLEAIWLNLSGARRAYCYGDFERARELWLATLQKLDTIGDGSQEVFVTGMRNAVMFALGSADAQLGLASAIEWAERLDSDPFQRVSALNLRKILKLEQGDAEGAERLRRQAEVLSLQLRTPSMFNTTLTLELFAYAQCNHLVGLTQCIEQLRPLAAEYPGWIPVLLNAEGSFQLVRGDYEAARCKFAACIERQTNKNPGPTYAWSLLAARTGLAECLMALGSYEDARITASTALTESGTSASASFEILRVLGLAEGKLGDPRGAERLDALIAQQTALGMSGLLLGLSYEARARVAIWSGDTPAFERFSELTAREYRHGARTPLGARYERLMNEAARAGMHAKLTLAEFQALAGAGSSTLGSDELLTMVTRSMAGHRSADERTQIALQVICVAHGAREGHLFLLTQAGPILRASHGAGTPVAELAERVQAFVTEKRRLAEDLDEMSTDALAPDAPLEWTVQVENRRYQLLQLSCVVDAASVLTGVAVVEDPEGRTRNEQQAQLLQVLAASLLQAGDTQGIAL